MKRMANPSNDVRVDITVWRTAKIVKNSPAFVYQRLPIVESGAVLIFAEWNGVDFIRVCVCAFLSLLGTGFDGWRHCCRPNRWKEHSAVTCLVGIMKNIYLHSVRVCWAGSRKDSSERERVTGSHWWESFPFFCITGRSSYFCLSLALYRWAGSDIATCTSWRSVDTLTLPTSGSALFALARLRIGLCRSNSRKQETPDCTSVKFRHNLIAVNSFDWMLSVSWATSSSRSPLSTWGSKMFHPLSLSLSPLPVLLLSLVWIRW